MDVILTEVKLWILGGWDPLLAALDVFSAASFFLATQSRFLGTSLKSTVPSITSSKLFWIIIR